MALLDVCGFQNTALSSRENNPLSLSLFSSDTFFLGKAKNSLKTLLQKDTENFYFAFPFLHTLLKKSCKIDSSFFSTFSLPVPLSHGTTTLGFVFQGGVIAAADTRASCSGLIACPCVKKIMPIHSHLVATTSGSGADCMLWQRILSREIRLYQLRHGQKLSVGGAAKLLSVMLHPFKGTDVCVALTLCGVDEESKINQDLVKQNCGMSNEVNIDSLTLQLNLAQGNSCARSTANMDFNTSNRSDVIDREPTGIQVENIAKKIFSNPCFTKNQSGPSIHYVCSDGLLLKGDVMSVGSGSPYAYSILDDGWNCRMSVSEAVALAREAVCRATYRDAYSGNNVDIFHITSCGWRRRRREDLNEEFFKQMVGLDSDTKRNKDQTEIWGSF